jgi:hypothetical protein
VGAPWNTYFGSRPTLGPSQISNGYKKRLVFWDVQTASRPKHSSQSGFATPDLWSGMESGSYLRIWDCWPTLGFLYGLRQLLRIAHPIEYTEPCTIFFAFCSTRSNQPYRCLAATKLIIMAAEDDDNSSSGSSTPLSTGKEAPRRQILQSPIGRYLSPALFFFAFLQHTQQSTLSLSRSHQTYRNGCRRQWQFFF